MGPETMQKQSSWAFQLALCLFGPLLFVTLIFSILSPLPGLYLYAGNPDSRTGRIWFFLSLIIGFILVLAVSGPSTAIGYILMAGLPALVLSELLLRKKGPEKAIVAAFALLLVSIGSMGLGISAKKGVLITEGKAYIETQTKVFFEKLITQNPDLPEATLDEFKKITKNPELFVYEEIPGILLSSLFLLCALPCLALIRWNPKNLLRRAMIPRDFLRKWASPEWYIWPPIVCITFILIEVPYVSLVAKNIIYPILLVYFFQGMSILAYFLDSLRIRGVFRIIIYGAGIMFTLPMIVSFGFFDLWFQFRNRRRSNEDSNESQTGREDNEQ